MLGQQERRQLEFFVCGSLRDLLPDDHVLARVDRVLDLSWLPAEVGALYAPGVGRPGIAPEAAVRLMLAGFLLGIVHDRRLLREAQVNLAIRWFAGYGLQERLPDHSSLTRIRVNPGPKWGHGPAQYRAMAAGLACASARVASPCLTRAEAHWPKASSWGAASFLVQGLRFRL
jgi:transposase